MRSVFVNLRDLFGYYRFIKADVRGTETILPGKDYIYGNNGNVAASRSRMEEKFCFIGDVEGFLKHYRLVEQRSKTNPIPHDCIRQIFMTAFSDDAEYKSLNRLAGHFRKRINNGVPIPRYLGNRGNILKVIRHMVSKMHNYYSDKGMLLRKTQEECLSKTEQNGLDYQQ